MFSYRGNYYISHLGVVIPPRNSKNTFPGRQLLVLLCSPCQRGTLFVFPLPLLIPFPLPLDLTMTIPIHVGHSTMQIPANMDDDVRAKTRYGLAPATTFSSRIMVQWAARLLIVSSWSVYRLFFESVKIDGVDFHIYILPMPCLPSRWVPRWICPRPVGLAYHHLGRQL